MSLPATASHIEPNVKPRDLLMKMVQRAMETIMQKVFRKSIQITALTPPRNVYAMRINTVTATLTKNGRPNGPNTIICRAMHTRYSLTDAPNILEMKKNQAPVR